MRTSKEQRMIDQAIKNLTLSNKLHRKIQYNELFGKPVKLLKKKFKRSEKLWIEAIEYLEAIDSRCAEKLGLLDG